MSGRYRVLRNFNKVARPGQVSRGVVRWLEMLPSPEELVGLPEGTKHETEASRIPNVDHRAREPLELSALPVPSAVLGRPRAL